MFLYWLTLGSCGWEGFSLSAPVEHKRATQSLVSYEYVTADITICSCFGWFRVPSVVTTGVCPLCPALVLMACRHLFFSADDAETYLCRFLKSVRQRIWICCTHLYIFPATKSKCVYSSKTFLPVLLSKTSVSYIISAQRFWGDKRKHLRCVCLQRKRSRAGDKH